MEALVVVALLVVSLVGRTDENRWILRVLGYGTVIVVGVGLGLVLGLVGLVGSTCNVSSAEGCTAKEEAQVRWVLAAALAAPVVTVGGYAVLDTAVERRAGRRRGPGPG